MMDSFVFLVERVFTQGRHCDGDFGVSQIDLIKCKAHHKRNHVVSFMLSHSFYLVLLVVKLQNKKIKLNAYV